MKSDFRPAKIDEYVEWLRRYKGRITGYYDYPFAESNFVVPRGGSFSLNGERGKHAHGIIVIARRSAYETPYIRGEDGSNVSPFNANLGDNQLYYDAVRSVSTHHCARGVAPRIPVFNDPVFLEEWRHDKVVREALQRKADKQERRKRQKYGDDRESRRRKR